MLFAQAEQTPTIDAYENYIEQYPQGAHIVTARERIVELERSITWSSDSRLIVGFKPALTAQGFGLKDLPLQYFVYLYTQAATGQYLRLYLPVRPLTPEPPARPELSKGEFESSKDFEIRSKKTLDEWYSEVNELNATHSSVLANWQREVQNYKDKLIQLRLQTQDSDRIFSWQQKAVRTALSYGFKLNKLQYNADDELFSYEISSRSFTGNWQGKLAVPIDQAQHFKSNLEDESNLRLHFYLNPTGKLELLSLTDIGTNIRSETQNVITQPKWLPMDSELEELALSKVTLNLQRLCRSDHH